MMTAKKMFVGAAAGALLAISAVGVRAESTAPVPLQPRAAFMEAYVFACQPVEYDFAGARDPLKPAALEIYTQLFVGVYHDSCRDFYFNEVVPRLDVDQRPYFPG